MSRREGQLFVGRLSKHTRSRDLEDVFEPYGRLSRCDLKYGAEMGYAFVDYEDRRDAEDALRHENGRDLCGSNIIVEWAKGNPRSRGERDGGGAMYRGGGGMRGGAIGGGGGRSRGDECFKCGRSGHWARDCPDDLRYGYRRPSRSGRSRSGSRDRYRSRSRDRDSSKRRRSRRSRTPSDRSASKSPRPANGHSRSRSR